MYQIAIIGIKGHVGNSMLRLFSHRDDYRIIGYDLGLGSQKEVNQGDLAIICVPTPQAKDGQCDVSIVKKTVSWLKTPLILIKSTITPGTTVSLRKKYQKRICFSPEYYGESRYYQPDDWSIFQWPYLIIGGEKKDCQEILEIFLPILGPTKNYFITDATTAELVKYWENIFGAMKVVFANEMYEICQRFGVCYEEARELWAQDPRVNRNHTSVFVHNRGFGGKCFPKDLAGLIKATEKFRYDPKFLKAIQRNNRRFRRMNKKKNETASHHR